MKILLCTLALIIVGIGIAQAQVSGTIYCPNGAVSSYNGNCSSGTVYGPNGSVTTWSGGPQGGTIYGPNGSVSTYTGNESDFEHVVAICQRATPWLLAHVTERAGLVRSRSES